MRSNVSDVLPAAVKRSLTKFGSDLATARRKRGLTVLAVAERMGVAKNTFLRAEKGDPKVGLGAVSYTHLDVYKRQDKALHIGIANWVAGAGDLVGDVGELMVGIGV